MAKKVTLKDIKNNNYYKYIYFINYSSRSGYINYIKYPINQNPKKYPLKDVFEYNGDYYVNPVNPVYFLYENNNNINDNNENNECDKIDNVKLELYPLNTINDNIISDVFGNEYINDNATIRYVTEHIDLLDNEIKGGYYLVGDSGLKSITVNNWCKLKKYKFAIPVWNHDPFIDVNWIVEKKD